MSEGRKGGRREEERAVNHDVQKLAPFYVCRTKALEIRARDFGVPRLFPDWHTLLATLTSKTCTIIVIATITTTITTAVARHHLLFRIYYRK